MKRPYLRDGIDVYVTPEEGDVCTLIFIFLSTRKRIHLQAKTGYVTALPLLNGDNTIDAIAQQIDISKEELNGFVAYLESKNIVSSKNWLEAMAFDADYKSMIEKQLYFLMDILGSPQAVFDLQKRIRETMIAIFGIGSTGSWLLVELLQMGFTHFRLYDPKEMQEDSVARHAYFSRAHVGEDKVAFYRSLAQQINPAATILAEKVAITPDSAILDGLADVDLIVNCADEPYIGYTNIFLSRYCVQNDKLLFVAGGFDAHLGCLGEMIVPHKTPCADCYHTAFRESLKEWKPLPHPVHDRAKGFGGLSPLGAFSASTAAMSILRCLIDEEEFAASAGGRGEFLFDEYRIDSFEVQRDVNCRVCGDEAARTI